MITTPGYSLRPIVGSSPRVRRRNARRLAAGVIAACLSASLAAQSMVDSKAVKPGPVTAEVSAGIAKLLAAPSVKKVLDDVRADDERAREDLRVMTEIEAPSFKESVRATHFLKRMKELGLSDAQIDKEGNVIGLRKGTGKGPTLLVSAHLDTVFPSGTDVKVKVRDGKWYAPGVSDDTRGLAVLLSWLKVLNDNKLQTVGDLLFVANVGEEGLGDLRGMKALFREHPEIDGMLGLEPSVLSGPPVIIGAGTASHRYEIKFRGPGGHSFAAFGQASALHAMGRAMARISDVRVSADPYTTFTVGTASGGTSVNTIAGDAKMEVDIRSNGMKELLDAERKILAAVEQGVADENARWAMEGDKRITYATRLVGDRPGGTVSPDSRLIQSVVSVRTAMGHPVPLLIPASADANVPLALGIPATILGSGGDTGGFHTRDEWWDPANAWVDAQLGLGTALGLVGVAGVTQPLLEIRRH